MAEPVWLSVALVEALHDEVLAQFGGDDGVRDRALLESAVARPRNKHAYEPATSLPELAASLGYGVIRNHPFIDGNKRAGDLCIRVFLFLNGWRYEPQQADEAALIDSVAAGSISEEELARWIAANTERERSL